MNTTFIPQRLYTQLALLVSIILTATFFSFGWITLHGHWKQQLQSMRDNAEIISRSLAEGCAQHLLVEDYAGLEVYLAKSVILPDIISLQVCDPDGKVVSDAFKESGDSQKEFTPPTQPLALLQNDQKHLIVWQPLLAGSHLGWLRVSVSLEALSRHLTEHWINTLLLTLLWILISVMLLLFFLKRPVKLIQSITAFARNLNNRKGDTLDTLHGPIELIQLGEAINNASMELKNSEQSLISEQERLAVTLQSLGEGVIATDTSGQITLCNTLAETLTGYPRQEALGCQLSEIFILENNRQDLIQAVLAAEKNFEAAEPPILISRDGQRRHISITAAPILDVKAGAIGVVMVFKDISEQRKAEQERKLNEERFESLFTLSQMASASKQELTDFALEEGVRLTGSEVGYLHFYTEDEHSLQLFSWSRQTLSQCTAAKDPHYALGEAGIWADSVRNRQPVIHNNYPEYPAKKGYPSRHFPVLRHMSVPVFDNGRIVAVAGVGNKKEPYDQTDVRQLTLFMNNMLGIMKQKQANDSARLAKKEWERTFDSIDDPMTIHDTEMCILKANKAAERLLAIPREEMRGRHCYDIFNGSPQPCPDCPETITLVQCIF